MFNKPVASTPHPPLRGRQPCTGLREFDLHVSSDALLGTAPVPPRARAGCGASGSCAPASPTRISGRLRALKLSASPPKRAKIRKSNLRALWGHRQARRHHPVVPQRPPPGGAPVCGLAVAPLAALFAPPGAPIGRCPSQRQVGVGPCRLLLQRHNREYCATERAPCPHTTRIGCAQSITAHARGLRNLGHNGYASAMLQKEEESA